MRKFYVFALLVGLAGILFSLFGLVSLATANPPAAVRVRIVTPYIPTLQVQTYVQPVVQAVQAECVQEYMQPAVQSYVQPVVQSYVQHQVVAYPVVQQVVAYPVIQQVQVQRVVQQVQVQRVVNVRQVQRVQVQRVQAVNVRARVVSSPARVSVVQRTGLFGRQVTRTVVR